MDVDQRVPFSDFQDPHASLRMQVNCRDLRDTWGRAVAYLRARRACAVRASLSLHLVARAVCVSSTSLL